MCFEYKEFCVYIEYIGHLVGETEKVIQKNYNKSNNISHKVTIKFSFVWMVDKDCFIYPTVQPFF